MEIVAPLSRYKKSNYLIAMAALLVVGGWFVYDGYFNQDFIQKHSTETGEPTDTLLFNRYAWPFCFAGAGVALGLYFLKRNRKLVATDEALLTGRETIPYDAIEKVDKTHFDSKGWFVVTYRTDGGAERDVRLSDRHYDNLPAVLDTVVAKIS